MSVKRAAIWAAVSSLPQAKKISLEDHLATGRAHADRHGAQVVAELVVPGESRDIVLFEEAARRINAYSQLEALIRTKGIDVLVYLDRSRLGRTAALSMAVAELCNRAGILLYETESPPRSLEFRPADHSDMLIGAIKSVDAQQEIRKIQERHRKGMADRVTKGKMPGKTNWGYIAQYDSGRLTGYAVDEEAAATVRLIVELYLKRGFGATNIADHLNRLGRVAPAGGQWGHSQITFLLRRIWRYAGYAELNVYSATGRPYVRAKGQWPAIISEEQARAVIAEQQERSNARRSVHTVYRFTRMVYCGVCGSRFHSQTKTRAWERDDGSIGYHSHVSYKCPAEHTSIGEKKIVAEMIALIQQLSESPEARSQWTAPPLVDHSATIQDEIATLQTQIDRLNDGITKADLDYYGRGALEQDADRHSAIVAGLKKRILSIAAEITSLENKLYDAQRVANRANAIDDIITHGLAYLRMEDARTANAWLRTRFTIHVEARQVRRIVPLI